MPTTVKGTKADIAQDLFLCAFSVGKPKKRLGYAICDMDVSLRMEESQKGLPRRIASSKDPTRVLSRDTEFLGLLKGETWH